MVALKQLPTESIDLVYIDPPFFSKRNYQAECNETGEVRSFSDSWAGGIQTYIDWLKPRVEQLHRVLKPTGTLFLHCDWHADAYIRVLVLDPIFGTQHLINNIAWCYSTGGKSKTAFGKKHDTLFWYAKGNTWTFNADKVKIEMRSGSKSFGGKLCSDPDGRQYRLVYGSKNKQGETRYYKYYLDEGKTPEDWWTDINSLQASSAERLHYPTQKPELLLERIILAASNPNDVVLDPCLGSGTTVAVAKRLGRHWIGIDQSVEAIELAKKRLAADDFEV